MGLVEACGKSYVIEHYIAFFKNEQRKKAYMIYVTDTLRVISENTSRNGGKYMNKRFIDVIEPHVEERTAEDIITSIKNRLSRL